MITYINQDCIYSIELSIKIISLLKFLNSFNENYNTLFNKYYKINTRCSKRDYIIPYAYKVNDYLNLSFFYFNYGYDDTPFLKEFNFISFIGVFEKNIKDVEFFIKSFNYKVKYEDLYYANNPEILKLLIYYYNKRNYYDNYCRNLIRYYLTNNKPELVETLICNNFHISSHDIFIMCHFNELKLLKLLLSYNPEITKNNYIYACKANNLKILRLLLSYNSKVFDDHCVIYACKNNNLKMLKLLLSYKSEEPTIFMSPFTNESAFNYAYKNNNPQIFKLLLSYPERFYINNSIIKHLIKNTYLLTNKK